MRYQLTVVSLVVVLVGALLARADKAPPTVVERPHLLALAVPERVVAGEGVSLFGGLQVPAGSFELGTYACQSGSCSRSFWRVIEGPSDVWGGFGSVQFDGAAMPATIEVRLFEANESSDRVVATWRRSARVIAPNAGAERLTGSSVSRGMR